MVRECTGNWLQGIDCSGCSRHSNDGYMKCQHSGCGTPVPEISKQTPLEFARCAEHGTWSSRAHGKHEPAKEQKAKASVELGSKKGGKPIRFIQNLLSDKPITADEIKAALVKDGYSPGTAGGQLYQLKNWDGCVVTPEGFIKAKERA